MYGIKEFQNRKKTIARLNNYYRVVQNSVHKLMVKINLNLPISKDILTYYYYYLGPDHLSLKLRLKLRLTF